MWEISMGEAIRLRQLAAAIEQYELLKGFDFKVAGGSDVRVEWRLGASCPGYKEMAAAISEVVSERYEELRGEAMSRAAAKIQAARIELEDWQARQGTRGPAHE